MHQDAADWIKCLNLERHPEGGYFRESYRAAETIATEGLPARFGGPRSCSTAIYFLLEGNDFSALHRIRSDELWHFYAGSALSVHVIYPQGHYRTLQLGGNWQKGQSFQATVPAGCWFGATVDEPGSFALVGCTVAPGFDFADFEMGERGALLERYPQHRGIIEKLTRP